VFGKIKNKKKLKEGKEKGKEIHVGTVGIIS
jgi:hypothetical protein